MLVSSECEVYDRHNFSKTYMKKESNRPEARVLASRSNYLIHFVLLISLSFFITLNVYIHLSHIFITMWHLPGDCSSSKMIKIYFCDLLDNICMHN